MCSVHRYKWLAIFERFNIWRKCPESLIKLTPLSVNYISDAVSLFFFLARISDALLYVRICTYIGRSVSEMHSCSYLGCTRDMTSAFRITKRGQCIRDTFNFWLFSLYPKYDSKHNLVNTYTFI
ncbi:hypothetical protein AHAS_Ahas15G0084600 [Arachis hypogaea]